MTQTFYCFENQRRLSAFGEWSEKNLSSLLFDPPSWCDDTEKPLQKESVGLPQDGRNWTWNGDWKIVMNEGRDKEGWQYSFKWPDFVVGFKASEDGLSLVRRRTWSRTCIVVPPKQPSSRANPPTKLRDYLFEGRTQSSESYQSQQPQQSQQSQQQEQAEECVKLSKEGKEASMRALQKASETEQIAVATLSQLHQQSQKLRTIESGLDDVDTHSKQAERIISGMQSIPSTVLNAFKPKVQAVTSDSSKFYEPKIRENPEGKKSGESSRKPPKSTSTEGQLWSESNATEHFGEKGQQIHRNLTQADQNLDQLDASVARLKVIAVDMGNELQRQNEHIDHLNLRAEKSTEAVKKNRREMKTVN